MDRLDRLEKMWLFYKIKQYAKMAFIVLFAVFLGGLIVYFTLYKKGAVQPRSQQSSVDLVGKTDIVLPKLVEQRAYVMQYPLALVPDFSFENAINRDGEASDTSRSSDTGGVVSKVGSVASLEAAYVSSPTYDKAIDIAKIYLKHGDNQKAMRWALKANEIDSNDDESWEIYALVSVKIGEKDQAIKALKAFLDAKPSKKLANLLNELESK